LTAEVVMQLNHSLSYGMKRLVKIEITEIAALFVCVGNYGMKRLVKIEIIEIAE